VLYITFICSLVHVLLGTHLLQRPSLSSDRKTSIHRSEHLRVDKFVSFIPMSNLYLNSNNSSTTFPVCKKE